MSFVLPVSYISYNFYLEISDDFNLLNVIELRELYLCNHLISEVPAAIGELKLLQVLSLRNNNIEMLPAQICECVNLQKLYLQGNKMSTLPNLFGKLVVLQDLNLSANDFTDFPEVLTSLTHLVNLEFSDNKLTTLPRTLNQMKCLSYLNLEGNPIKMPPAALAKTPWIEVKGCILPPMDKASKEFAITPAEEFELLGLLKSRAAFAITSKLRRRKKKSGYDV